MPRSLTMVAEPSPLARIGLSVIVGSSFGTAAVITTVVATYITLYDGMTSLRHIDTGTHMFAGMMNNDASWTGLGIHPYLHL